MPNLSNFNDDGIDISINDMHLSKECLPIEVTEEGIDILIKDEHPEKTESPIEVTEEGIGINLNDEQFKKADSLIDVINYPTNYLKGIQNIIFLFDKFILFFWGLVFGHSKN